MNRLIENEMKREEVLKHFENVTKVKCLTNGSIDIYTTEIKEGLCGWWSMNNTLLYNKKNKQFAPIVEKVVDEPKHKNETPKHYKTNSIDVIDFCKIYNLNFNLGSVVKYSCRAGEKIYDGLTKKESRIKDLKKAIDFLNRELKYIESK